MVELKPSIEVVTGDIAELDVGVVALKYAQARYDVDKHVASLLLEVGVDGESISPRPGGFRLVNSQRAIAARKVLFVGVPDLRRFGYREIREFARRALSALAGEAPEIESVALTLHGAGYGLDETEAFESEVAGLLDAISEGDTPRGLASIKIVERNRGRAQRLKKVLEELIPVKRASETAVPLDLSPVIDLNLVREERLRAAGYASDSKAHVFVAMPFKEEMNDVYHYGIQGAVHHAGLLCERADHSSFTGDVLEWVRRRIKSAALLIADLSGANPNVYLEVGYAWGCSVPTVLLVRETDELKFDVRGQRCLVYKSIRDLEEALRKELRALLGKESSSQGG